jgi:hypothetical protein
LSISGKKIKTNQPSICHPEDRLYFRTEPHADAYSLGKYCNGAAVTVDSILGNGTGEWTSMNIGDSQTKPKCAALG